MKKLMTMLAAAATAFGLFAADAKFISGAGFDTSDADAVGTKLTWTTPTGFSALWSGTDGTAIKVETGHTGIADNNHPLYFSNDSDRLDDQHLTIQTTGGALVSQKIAADPFEIGSDGLYFDGLVQFTSFEDQAPDIDDGAKIAVFPMVDDPEADTPVSHLIVKAQGTAETNLWKTARVIDDGWHRVTIKMINNILKTGSQVGFVVYIDKVAVECAAAMDALVEANLTAEAKSFYAKKQLFASLGNSAEMTEVAFGGKGAIDEIAFTETAPDFATSPIFCTLTGATGIASFMADGLTWTNGGAAIEAEIKSGSVSVTAITADTGYFIPAGADATNFTGVVKGATLTVDVAKALGATVEIEDQDPQYFESAAVALVELNKVEAATTAKLTLNAETSDAITIDNVNLELTLDLAGKEIVQGEADAAINVNNGALTIIDSEGDGVVSANPEMEQAAAAVLAWGGSLAITDGQYDGLVAGSTIAITGGEFLASANDKETLQAFVTLPDTVLVEENGYFVLQAITDFTVEVPEAAANTKLMVTIDDVLAGMTNGTYTVDKESTLKAVYTADTGYELDGKGDWTVDYETKDTEIIAPTATIKTFTVTFNPNNGGENIVSNNVPYGTAFDDVKPADPTKTGYTFTGWDPAGAEVTDDAEYTAQYTEIAVTEITLDKSSVTIYVGGTSNVVATIVPDTALTKTVTWDYTALEGYATAEAEGNTLKITGTVAQPVSSSPMVIKAKVGAVEATCDVFVVPVPTAGPTTDTPGAEVEEQDLPGGKVAVVTTTDPNVTEVNLSGLGATTSVQVDGQIDSIKGLGEGNNIIVKSRGGTAYDITAFCKIDRSGDTATISLDPAKATPVIGEVTIDDKPVAPVSADGTVGFQTKPGLYYTLIAGNEPGAVTVNATEPTLATGEAMKLTADPAKFTPTGAKAFFKVDAAK